jgi:hypothetical protein
MTVGYPADSSATFGGMAKARRRPTSPRCLALRPTLLRLSTRSLIGAVIGGYLLPTAMLAVSARKLWSKHTEPDSP